MKPKLWGALIAATALASGCASLSPPQTAERAPQPAKPIEAPRFYAGRWYEIARTPMKLTDGCVAGTTDYFMNDRGVLIDKDACRKDSPTGKEKQFTGPVTFLNGENTKVRVDYRVFGLFTAQRTYWMLDHGDDYSWFIVSDPAFENLSLFTREAHPSGEAVMRLAARAKALGYDVTKLEYPAQSTSSEP